MTMGLLYLVIPCVIALVVYQVGKKSGRYEEQQVTAELLKQVTSKTRAEIIATMGNPNAPYGVLPKTASKFRARANTTRP